MKGFTGKKITTVHDLFPRARRLAKLSLLYANHIKQVKSDKNKRYKRGEVHTLHHCLIPLFVLNTLTRACMYTCVHVHSSVF